MTFDKWRENFGIVEIGSDCTVDNKGHTHLTFYNFRGRMWATGRLWHSQCINALRLSNACAWVEFALLGDIGIRNISAGACWWLCSAIIFENRTSALVTLTGIVDVGLH